MNNIETEVFPAVEPEADKVYRVAETASSMVPFGSAVFKSLVTAPFEKRLDKWTVEVTDALNQLIEKHGKTVEELQNNEQFIDFILNLSQSATKTSQQEKISYLKAALINSALQPFDDKDEYNYFLNILDSFSAAHIRVLLTYNGVVAGLANEKERLKEISDYDSKGYIYDQVLSDLISKELIIAKPDDSFGLQVYRSKAANKFIKLLAN
ncbi:hypothetical protein V9R55_003573 [Vibrio cholerae]|uniref:hypothetical protein n=2 Tax=Vibrio cholerae TaxID=666 RepID=UPI0010FD85C1|nr:hypothetical protein [Vibrio cholerae]TLE17433.1 hypothetical protein D2924_18355 [Vibrio cholerae]TLE26655.1 hypothetical protein D2925_18705 [Vibrio cholerae]